MKPPLRGSGGNPQPPHSSGAQVATDVQDVARPVEGNPIPDMTGRVITVAGPVGPDGLGVTLMHEHLFLDLRKSHLPHPVQVQVSVEDRTEPLLTTEDFPTTELALWEAKLGPDNLGLAREMAPIADNYVLEDQELAIREVMEFGSRGGKTIVDVTSIGLKRDPAALLRVSEATGLNIVMGAGRYQKLFHLEDMDSRTVEELTDEIVGDITVGVGDTGIRAGIIGEIGINGDPITANEAKTIRAAARASRLTGAAITFHRGGHGAERHHTLDLVIAEKADLDRVILGHSDEIAADLGLMLELLERGVYLQFDLLGRTEALAPFEKGKEAPGVSLTERSAQAISRLLDAGYQDRVLISQDVCWKTHLKKYGGFGYSYILESFLPDIRKSGVTEGHVHRLIVENPRRLLPLVPPRS